jgi:hypothetical protein
MNSSIMNLSVQQLRRAANIKDKIQSLENKLSRILGSPAEATANGAPKLKRRRKMSAAARRKISLAAKARWAKVKRHKK